MDKIRLPETVVAALGQEASRDLAAWLASQYQIFQIDNRIQISAFVARQKVNVLMLEEVSNLLLANSPSLEKTSKGGWQWRVPIDLTLADQGRVGRVGEITVDAHYGTVHYDDASLEEITLTAEALAERILASSV
jgi:hypothetical protein